MPEIGAGLFLAESAGGDLRLSQREGDSPRIHLGSRAPGLSPCCSQGLGAAPHTERRLNGREKCYNRTLARASGDRPSGGPHPRDLGIPGLNKDRWSLEPFPLHLPPLQQLPRSVWRHLHLGIASFSLQPGTWLTSLATSALFFSSQGPLGKTRYRRP